MANSFWMEKEVAVAQHNLVMSELAMSPLPQVYLVFIDAIKVIGPDRIPTLLDIGCGVGHYACILHRYFPSIHYVGTDVSRYMIEIASQTAPFARFYVREFFKNDLSHTDAVMASSSMEYTEDPVRAMRFLLNGPQKFTILHRLHLTQGETAPVLESTYCGKKEPKMHWNGDDVLQIVKDAGAEVLFSSIWSNREMMTMVVANAH